MENHYDTFYGDATVAFLQEKYALQSMLREMTWS